MPMDMKGPPMPIGGRAIFSICAENYLARAAVLMASAARFLPGYQQFLVLTAAAAPSAPPPAFPTGCRILTPDEMDVPRLDLRRRIYNVTELCTSIKADAFRHLFAAGFDEVLYFDPDVKLFAPPEEIDATWRDGADIALTPHVIVPGEHPDWVMRAVARSGQFNLGFLGLRRSARAQRALSWWHRQTALDCVEDPANGVFVDQKVVDFFVSLFPGCGVIRHRGYNVAYWNLHERPLSHGPDGYLVDGVPLAFFHFSGFSIFRDRMSRHTAHLANAGPPNAAVARIMREYASELVGNGELGRAQAPYTYGDIAGGRNSETLRRALRAAAGPDGGNIAADHLDRPDFLTEACPADDGIGFPAPRLMRLLAHSPTLPEELRREIARYLRAGIAERRAMIEPILVHLHHLGAVDAGCVETIADAAPPEHLAPRATRATADALAAPRRIALPEAADDVELPLLLLLVQYVRRDLARAFDLRTRKGAVALATWFLAEGTKTYPLAAETVEGIVIALDRTATAHGSILDAALVALHASPGKADDVPAEASDEDAMLAILRGDRSRHHAPLLAAIRKWIWRREAGGIPRIVRLLGTSRRVRAALFGAHPRRRVPHSAIDAALAAIGLADLASHSPTPPAGAGSEAPRRAVGSVVVGPFAGFSGVGTSAHGVRALLRYAGIGGLSVDVMAPRDTVARRLSGLNPRLLMLHVNADITLDAIVKFHDLWCRAERRAAYWYWELPEMTRRMAAASLLLDEVWVATDYVRRSVAPASTAAVRVVPPPIDPGAFRPTSAAGGSFGAGKRRYRFLGVADSRSFVARKNPDGILRAFRRAFPAGDEAAELVVKLSNGRGHGAALAEFDELARGDRRIRVVDGTLTQAEMNDLYQSADCFVSLHRAEGLGLGIVQAMMRGKPVIATGFSGPMDFLTDANSLLVPFTLAPVPPDSYPDWIGQVWAEPDETAAAVYMKELARRPDAGAAIGRRATSDARSFFAFDRIREIMRREAGI